MPLQNRVKPTGEIVALPGRGLIMGNRGILHDGLGRIVRNAQSKRWIACRTEFRGRRLSIMAPNHYTQLFFLDEATALAAGHRPCAECRNADYKQFRKLWENAFGKVAGANDIDAVLHAERLDGKKKRLWLGACRVYPTCDDGRLGRSPNAMDSSSEAETSPLAGVWARALPDGAYVLLDGVPRIIWAGELVAWNDSGYGDRKKLPAHEMVDVLTTPSIVTLIRAGYRPKVHSSIVPSRSALLPMSRTAGMSDDV